MDAVSQILREHDRGFVVTKMVCLVEGIDSEREDAPRGMWTFAAPGVTRWDSYGMLMEALTKEQVAAMREES